MPVHPRTPKRPVPGCAQQARALRLLAAAYAEADCALHHRNAFELLVATILSAQCTDKRVNLVTPALFARYPDAAAMATAPLAELETLVKTTGFFRNKSKNILAAAQALVTHHAGQVPRTMAALVALPGVARKTANVVLGVAYGLSEGVVVDTHVLRLAKRLGLSAHEDPIRVERDLMALVPKAQWIATSHRLIAHGRAVCKAARPQCPGCPLLPSCPSAVV